MLEDWLRTDQRLPEEHFFRHDVFLPNLLKVLPIEDGHFTLDLCEEPRFQGVEQLALVLQIVQNVTFAEFGAGSWQQNVLFMILHKNVARDDDVYFIGLEEQQLPFL